MVKKFLVFSDLHLTNKNKHYKRDSDGLSDLLKRQIDFLKYLFELGKDLEVDGIIFTGDLTDEDMIDTYVLSSLFELVNLVQRCHCPVYFIEGNHGITDRDNQYSIIGSLARCIPNCFYKTEIHEVVIPLEKGFMTFDFLPYGRFGTIEQILRDRVINPDSRANILFLHAPVINAQMDNGLFSTHGVELKEDMVDKYNLVLAGDFHKPQIFNVGPTVFAYCGAPFTLTKGQEFEKIIRLLEIEELEDSVDIKIKNIKNPFAMQMKTISCKNLTLDEIIKALEEVPSDGCVSITLSEIASLETLARSQEYLERNQNQKNALNFYDFHLKLDSSNSQETTSRLSASEKETLSDSEIILKIAKSKINNPQLLANIEKVVLQISKNQNEVNDGKQDGEG